MTFLMPALLAGLGFLAGTILLLAIARRFSSRPHIRKMLVGAAFVLMVGGSAVVAISSLSTPCPCTKAINK